MKRLLVLVAFLVAAISLCSCSVPTLELPERWRPLTHVVEAGDRLIEPGQSTCIGSTVYCGDLDAWLQLYPPGSALQDALLMHEQEHSRRQLSYPLGLAAWLARYVADADFRWREERHGWALEIGELVRRGVSFSPDNYADILSGYVHFGQPMVSREEARAWVLEVEATARNQAR